jgi:hypothetical protein
VTKMPDMARTPGPCGGRCPHAVGRPVTDVPDSAEFRREVRNSTSDATLSRGDAHRVKMSAVAFLTILGRYRERVDVEIGNASEHGARWWSCRLVQVCEEAGWVHLDK